MPISLILDPSIDILEDVTAFIQRALEIKSNGLATDAVNTLVKPELGQLRPSVFLVKRQPEICSDRLLAVHHQTFSFNWCDWFSWPQSCLRHYVQSSEQWFLYCLVRAKHMLPLKRLLDGFVETDPRRGFISSMLSQQKLIPLAGDLTKPYLGLDETLWGKLSGQVDAIVHNGALVNHVFHMLSSILQMSAGPWRFPD
ncbi:SDR family oxidoreductase [Sodalis ligni]|nr:SDR family oxidoreductase [Sodalis ligni]QWA09121.1 SDR family oxidoreductase [Sodalis ligni]